MNRKFLYYLLKKDGRSGQVINDVVTYSGQPKPLPQTPDGWQDLQILFERSIDKHGLLTLSSLPFGFVRNGGRIIRDALYKETIEAEIFLLIQRLELELTLTTYNWVYKYLIKGELDLSKAEDTRDMVSVPIMEIGLSKLLKANEKTVYDFPMDDPLCVNVKMDGIELDIKGNYVNIGLSDVGASGPHGSANYVLPITMLNYEGIPSGFAFLTSTLENISGDPALYFPVSTNYFFYNLTARSVRIHGSIKGDFGAGQSVRYRIQDNYNTVHFDTGSTLYTGFSDIPFDITVSLPSDTKLFIWCADALGDTIDYLDSEIKVEFVNAAATTYVKCYRRFDLFKKLCGKVFGDENVAISTLLETEEINNVLITCGDAIRGLEGATLKTSLDDFWKDCDATFMCGQMIVGDTFEIEDRMKYYTESVPAEEVALGFVTDLKITPAADVMFNTYKFGHPKQDIEDVNGKYDPNGTNQFTGPLTKVVREYNMVSPYKAGPYEIEMLRINLDGKTTTDDNSDNDVFVIAAEAQPPLTAEVGFSVALGGMTISFSDSEGMTAGQKIRITGSTLNDGVYDIFSVNPFLLFNVIVFQQSVVDETPISVTIEFLTGGLYTLSRPAYTTLEGVPHDSIFNLPFLTPKAMLLRHLRWIAGMNYGLGSQKIKFANGKDNKNIELKTVLAGVTIDEDKDESFSGVAPMFIPFYAAFKTEVPINIPESLETDPNRSFNYLDELEQEWKIFLRMGGFAPNDYTPQEFKGLLTPNNDIELLIHG